MQGLLFGVGPSDPLAYGSTAAGAGADGARRVPVAAAARDGGERRRRAARRIGRGRAARGAGRRAPGREGSSPRRIAAALLVRPCATAQTAPKTPRAAEGPAQSPQGDFDYLFGDWETQAVRKVPEEPQKLRGYWSAVRLDDGQVLDEYRVVERRGRETWYVTYTLRNYNVFMDRWELVGASSGTGLLDFGTARREGDEVRMKQTFGVASGEPSVLRIRYYDIQKDRFSWTADRSNETAAAWVKDFQQDGETTHRPVPLAAAARSRTESGSRSSPARRARRAARPAW